MRKIILALSLCAMVVQMGCKKSDSGTSPVTYTVSGRLFNITQSGVRGAVVTLTPTSGTALTATANDTGYYSVANVAAGTYSLKFSATGYTDTTLAGISVATSVSGRVDTLYGTANVSGSIVNSQTGTGLDSATVSFTFGTDTTKTDLKVKTSATGTFSLKKVPTGTFTCVVRRSNYFTSVTNNVSFTTGTSTLPSVIVAQVPPAGSFRIVLTWGATPYDLDSHLTGPDSTTGRFHCYYSNRTPTYANTSLDVDDVNGYGPETITIRQFRNGTYRYSVHDYSYQSSVGGDSIRASGTTVRVYNDQGLIKTYTPPSPATAGNTWRVFEYYVNGTTKTFSDNNGATLGYVTVSSSGDITNFKSVGGVKPQMKDVPEF